MLNAKRINWVIISVLMSLGFSFGPGDSSAAESHLPHGISGNWEAKWQESISQTHPWTDLELKNDPDNFQFVIVSDRTGGNRKGVFKDALAKVNLLQPEFVINVGDLISGYTEDQEQIDSQWQEIEGFIKQLEMPFFYVPGNHDISNPVMAQEWARRFGPSYYYFVYRDVLFLCLNTEDQSPSNISEEQIEFVAETLARNADVRWTLVFLHKPLWNQEHNMGWHRVEEMLKGRRHSVFAGHTHTYTKYQRNDTSYIKLATTGGGSTLRGPAFGNFDHVVWVTMTDNGPRIANLETDAIWDENVVTEEIAKLLAYMRDDRFIELQPIFIASAQFRQSKTQLHLTNKTDIPMRFQGNFGYHEYLVAQPKSIDLEVAPNSEKLIDLHVKAYNDEKAKRYKPLKLNWSNTYDHPKLKVPVMRGTSYLGVAMQFDIPTRSMPVTIDGKLDEWDNLEFVVEEPGQIKIGSTSWTGPDDCSWRFAVEMDKEYVYIAIEVIDDIPYYIGDKPWNQDGIEIRLDGRSDPPRSSHRGQGDNKEHLLIALSPAHDPADMFTFEAEILEAQGVKTMCIATRTGYNAEIAVPFSYFQQRQGQEWKAFRLNIAIDDFDDPNSPPAQLWWAPDWRTHKHVPGSGTFKRK